jgi:hypothetical protein
VEVLRLLLEHKVAKLKQIENLKSEAETTSQNFRTDLRTPSMAEQKQDTAAESTIAEPQDEIPTMKRAERDSILAELEGLSQTLFEESSKYPIRM